MTDILQEREKTHGDFGTMAEASQEIKYTIYLYGKKLSAQQREALDLIATKIARILTGNPDEPDHWDDIAGYARLGKGERGTPVTRVPAVGTDEHEAILAKVAKVAGRAMPPCPDLDGDVWCADTEDEGRGPCWCTGPCAWLNVGVPPGGDRYCKAGENYLR